jgi:hypothetical protein
MGLPLAGLTSACLLIYEPLFMMAFLCAGIPILLLCCLGLVFGITSLAFGITSRRTIKKKEGLKVLKVATAGILLSLLGFVVLYADYVVWDPIAQEEVCRGRMREIARALSFYSVDNNGEYPAPDKWCDLLLEGKHISKGFLTRTADKKAQHSYAINPNATPNSPADIVVVFETVGGWNQFGGLELLTTEHHTGKGCNVLFNDFGIQFVPSERLGDLKWENNQRQ